MLDSELLTIGTGDPALSSHVGLFVCIVVDSELLTIGTGDLVLSSHVGLFVCIVIDSELLTRVEKQM